MAARQLRIREYVLLQSVGLLFGFALHDESTSGARLPRHQGAVSTRPQTAARPAGEWRSSRSDGDDAERRTKTTILQAVPAYPPALPAPTQFLHQCVRFRGTGRTPTADIRAQCFTVLMAYPLHQSEEDVVRLIPPFGRIVYGNTNRFKPYANHIQMKNKSDKTALCIGHMQTGKFICLDMEPQAGCGSSKIRKEADCSNRLLSIRSYGSFGYDRP